MKQLFENLHQKNRDPQPEPLLAVPTATWVDLEAEARAEYERAMEQKARSRSLALQEARDVCRKREELLEDAEAALRQTTLDLHALLQEMQDEPDGDDFRREKQLLEQAMKQARLHLAGARNGLKEARRIVNQCENGDFESACGKDYTAYNGFVIDLYDSLLEERAAEEKLKKESDPVSAAD